MRSQTQQTSRCKFIFPGRKIHQPWRLPGLWKVSRVLKNSENRVGSPCHCGKLGRFRRFYQTVKVSGNLWQLFLFWILLRKLEYYGALLKEPFYMICIHVDVQDFRFLRTIFPGGAPASPDRISEVHANLGDHILRIMLDVAAERKVLKYTKEGTGRHAKASAVRGCLAERIPLTCARIGAWVAAPGGRGRGGRLQAATARQERPGWRWPRGRNYTQSPHAS